MSLTVAALFKNAADAHSAYHSLTENGYGEKVSIAMKDSSGKLNTESTSEVLEEAAEGAGIGAVAGALGGVALALIPGAPLLVAGPVVAAWGIAGGVLGSLMGGIAGALIELGFPENDAKAFEEGLRRGEALLVVESTDDTRAVTEILAGHNAVQTAVTVD